MGILTETYVMHMERYAPKMELLGPTVLTPQTLTNGRIHRKDIWIAAIVLSNIG